MANRPRRMPSLRALLRKHFPDALLVLLLALLLAAPQAQAGDGAAAAPADAVAQVARGRYLARIANCAACHTAPGGAPFAGGVVLRTGLGTIPSTNITPDADTGIGAYSLAEFDRALRQGVARGGKRLYPAMPYPSYARMTAEDVAALYAYLRAEVRPVRQRQPAPQLRWPFGMRSLLVVWNLFFLEAPADRASPRAAVAGGDAQWRRGAYLVQAVGHCGACHTPRGLLHAEQGSDERSQSFLAGASVEGWSAGNLRGDKLSGLGGWSREEVAEYLRTGRNIHATSFGPMSGVIAASTQHMTPQDLDAMAAYLKSLPGVRGESAPFRYDPATAQALLQGRFDAPGARLYGQYCMPCHGAGGKGFARVFPPLAGNPAVLDPDPSSLVNLLLGGAVTAAVDTAATDYHMPGYGWALNDQELADVLGFVRGGWGNRAAPVRDSEVAARRAALGIRLEAEASR
nr:cytochrome c [Cupriavidus malaysiensis]